MTLTQRINELIEQHGSMRAVARVMQTENSYLSRLHSGEKERPGKLVLRRLGLRSVTTYERTEPHRAGEQPKAHRPDEQKSAIERSADTPAPEPSGALAIMKALEFAEYMAKGAEQFLEAVNASDMAWAEVQESTDEAESKIAHEEWNGSLQTRGDFAAGLRSDIYEFRKRAAKVGGTPNRRRRGQVAEDAQAK